MTAVEWLVEEIKKDPNLRLRGFDIDGIAEQAKEMEKQQIIDAFNLGQQEEAKQPFWTKGNEYYEKNF
jgi:ribosomal protein L5